MADTILDTVRKMQAALRETLTIYGRTDVQIRQGKIPENWEFLTREALQSVVQGADCGLAPEDAFAFREVARVLHHLDGECEIDDKAPISCEDDAPDGAYVQAWVWVAREEL